MKARTVALALEAIAAGGPSTAATVYGFPVMFSLGMAGALQGQALPLLGLLQLAGSIWALFEFWRLAMATVLGGTYLFGWRFWFAVLGAVAGLAESVRTIPPLAVALFIGLPSLVVAHFSYLQLMVRRADKSTRALS
jgi:hypothetical protein